MSNKDFLKKERARRVPVSKTNSTPVVRADLVELVLEPLANQIDRARLEILDRIQEANESTDMVAREMRRELDE